MKNKLYYISIEESKEVYTVYKDWIFTTQEKCNDLYEWAVSKYGEDKVEICNFELDPSIGKFACTSSYIDKYQSIDEINTGKYFKERWTLLKDKEE